MNNKRSDTTVRINESRKIKIKKKILEIGNYTGDIMKPSEIVSYLIDNYIDRAVKDITEKNGINKDQ